MAIWSLTQEKVDKLLKQIGEKEQEIDTLIKLTVKDLWTRDLDDFIAEWRFQLEDDAKRQKKVANYGRRASNKLKLGAKGLGAKRGKTKAGNDDDDSDYETAKPKKASGPVRVQPKPVSAFFTALKNSSSPPSKAAINAGKGDKGQSKASIQSHSQIATAPNGNGISDSIQLQDEAIAAVVQKAGKAGPAKLMGTTNVAALNLDGNNETKVPARKARLAASKAIRYGDGSDSDFDDGDGMLGDVSQMVKGIGGGSNDGQLGAKPLFATSTSKTAGGSTVLGKAQGKSEPAQAMDISDDETDFTKLMPKPVAAQKAPDAESNNNDKNQMQSLLTSSDIEIASPAKPTMTKPTSKQVNTAGAGAKQTRTALTKKPAAATAKKVAAAAAKKAVSLSPAAKRAKTRKLLESDSDDDAFERDDDEDENENDVMDTKVKSKKAPPKAPPKSRRRQKGRLARRRLRRRRRPTRPI